MRIPRIFHGSPLKDQQRVALDPQSAKHLLTVLRLKPGAPLILFDGSGFEFEAKLDEASKKQVWVSLSTAHGPAVESPLRVTLAQGVSRGERMDYTVQKAVELGIAGIAPVLTERSVVKLDAASAAKKREHWQAVAIGACEQSGRVRVPEVQAPIALPSFLAARQDVGLKLLLDPLGGVSAAGLPKPADGRVLLLVGPEGGLSETERALAARTGFTGLKLGPRILRTETAALVALSLLQSKWGDLD
ncbi:MAG TPA: 16S rRNA (uracil(1498)-N(3))-methyltransferase [Gammaproteobacteria bacterium]|nr:16S rRNA (uracil(1498)-N(3))-methyltransferase [Gammaproteobacteria bacterium]